jgi:hypothetical protein
MITSLEISRVLEKILPPPNDRSAKYQSGFCVYGFIFESKSFNSILCVLYGIKPIFCPCRRFNSIYYYTVSAHMCICMCACVYVHNNFVALQMKYFNGRDLRLLNVRQKSWMRCGEQQTHWAKLLILELVGNLCMGA